MATREEKVRKKQERSLRRVNKRIQKDLDYSRRAAINDRDSISWGRRNYQGRIYACEMGYLSCELRGYCNGDC